MLIDTFHGKHNHTFTKIYKCYNRITTTADSEWCGAVNAMVVKNVKDANVLLKLLPIRRNICGKIWLQEKLTFICITYIMLFKTSKRSSSKLVGSVLQKRISRVHASKEGQSGLCFERLN